MRDSTLFLRKPEPATFYFFRRFLKSGAVGGSGITTLGET
jgi:hypothetical protein